MTDDPFAWEIDQSFHAAQASILETVQKLIHKKYADANERSLMVFALHGFVHHLAELNDILCKLDGVPNPMMGDGS